MVTWILFDIGNVLLIDEPLMALQWISLYQAVRSAGQALSFEGMMARREYEVIHKRASTPHVDVGISLLGEEGWKRVGCQVQQARDADFLRYSFVVDGAREILETLSKRYRLAIAANQPRGVFRKAMEETGLMDFFEVHGISDEVGLSKPDLTFFNFVLDKAGCAPHEAIMIGDRMDTDIAPAQRLGMKTIWVDMSPEAQGYRPLDELEKRYVKSLLRAPSRGAGTGNEGVQPDATVHGVGEIPTAVEKVAHG